MPFLGQGLTRSHWCPPKKRELGLLGRGTPGVCSRRRPPEDPVQAQGPWAWDAQGPDCGTISAVPAACSRGRRATRVLACESPPRFRSRGEQAGTPPLTRSGTVPGSPGRSEPLLPEPFRNKPLSPRS